MSERDARRLMSEARRFELIERGGVGLLWALVRASARALAGVARRDRELLASLLASEVC